MVYLYDNHAFKCIKISIFVSIQLCINESCNLQKIKTNFNHMAKKETTKRTDKENAEIFNKLHNEIVGQKLLPQKTFAL